MSVQNTNKSENKNVVNNTKEVNKAQKQLSFDKDILDSINALSLSENVKGASSTIFKKEFNSKSLRTKYRNALIRINLQEIEGGTTIEVQKGLIPQMLLQIQKGKKEDAIKTFLEIKEICKKVYTAEDNFAKADDYFSGNRSEKTKNILFAFISVAQSLNNHLQTV